MILAGLLTCSVLERPSHFVSKQWMWVLFTDFGGAYSSGSVQDLHLIPFSLPDETTIRQLHAIFMWWQRYINHFIREMIFCECLLVHRDGGNTLCWTVILGKTFRISLKSGFYPCTGNEVKPVLNGKHVKPIISMMKTRWIISFARLPVSVKNPNAPLSKGISCRSWSVRIIAISRLGN